MSAPINAGGPAFPHSSQPLDAQGNPLCGEHSEWGMTLRDYFAAKALQTMVQSYADSDYKHAENCAKSCYAFADAMLKAREVQS